MILLALCLIQASADNYYFRIRLYNDKNEPGEWSNYIYVSHDAQLGDWVNGLRVLAAGETVTDVEHNGYKLPKKANNDVDLDNIWGIEFANGEGKDNNNESDIMEGGEFKAWEKIREHIRYLRLRKYKRDTYTGDCYFAYMHNVEELELPEDGMTVGDGDNNMYFANADNLKKITIWNGDKAVDITDNTDDVVKKKKLLNSVGQFMFSNCYSLSTKYINRLIKDVTEIKNNAFSVDDGNRGKFSDEADNKMAIEIPNKVTKIGDQAFWNRVKVTDLNIQGNDDLVIGSEAFKACDELAKIQTPDNKVLRIDKNAFMRCKQLNAFENIDNAKITYLGTGVFGDGRSMTDDFVNDVLKNYAANGRTKIPAYLFFGCNG